MHTPYLIVWNGSPTSFAPEIHIAHRRTERRTCGGFTFHFFPPSLGDTTALFEDRLHVDGDDLWFEEGFMVRYPEPYLGKVRDKLDDFELPSVELDGAFSRITVRDGVLKIDGSATYLQTLYSYTGEGSFVLSNNMPLMEDFLRSSAVRLTVNDLFFASHLFQAPLAYYIFTGTQWREIDYHDSLDTIRFDGELQVELENKLSNPTFETLPREERINVLHSRLQHLIDEFCSWTRTERVIHHLTAGRDSRLSFSLFKAKHADRLRVETGGHRHTTDKVVANYISKAYGLESSMTAPPVVGSGFSYADLNAVQHGYRYQVALFRMQAYRTAFNPNQLVANGFLGNSTVYGGTKKRQVLPREVTALAGATYDELESRYDSIIADHEAVYGPEQVHRLFHLRCHTANKVSGVLGRLRHFSFCLFESDLLFLSYMLEEPEQMTDNSLHYELMRRADPHLVSAIPFEPGKSFPGTGHTSEVTEFAGIKRVGGHMIFVQLNFDAILAHIRDHLSEIPFFRAEYLDEIADTDRENIPNLVVKKLFGVLAPCPRVQGLPPTGADRGGRGGPECERYLHRRLLPENVHGRCPACEWVAGHGVRAPWNLPLLPDDRGERRTHRQHRVHAWRATPEGRSLETGRWLHRPLRSGAGQPLPSGPFRLRPRDSDAQGDTPAPLRQPTARGGRRARGEGRLRSSVRRRAIVGGRACRRVLL